MKGAIFLSILFTMSCVYSWERGDLESYGPFRLALNSNLIKCNHEKNLNLDVSEIKIFFYDFSNNYNASYPINDAAERLTKYYNLDVSRRLIFFVPGYKSHISKKTEELIRQTFHDFPNSYLIIVDHSLYTSSHGGRIDSYARSVKYTYYIGSALGQLLSVLKEHGYPASKMHCVGHSLGSQMLGYAGGIFTNRTNEKIWRITALDPAGPCFSNSFIEEQVRSGVAEYVEVYHCNAGGLGSTSVLGDIDFFFNKGSNQPTCKIPIIPGIGSPDVAKCSHKACLRYWAASVRHKEWYLAWECDSYKSFSKGKCAANHVTIAGFWNPGDSKGLYFVTTDAYEQQLEDLLV